MAEAVVSLAVETLSSLLIQEAEASTSTDLEDEIHILSNELMQMKAFLRDADARQIRDERLRDWVREVKALAYRCEDVIETFLIRVESRKGKCNNRILKKIMSLASSKAAKRDIESKIIEIRRDLEDHRKRIVGYGINEAKEEDSDSFNANDDYPWSMKTLLSYYCEGDGLSVGMDKDINLLLQSILNDSKNYQVISLCGMVGIGKTILARKLCSDERIQEFFEAFAWVNIPLKFSVIDVYKSIGVQLFDRLEPRNAVRDMELTELAERLLTFQQKHKCLIVLDHIPSLDAWEMLRRAFPLGQTASKLLITTRSLAVAQRASGTEGVIHTLTCLTEEDAWKLFNQYVKPGDVPGLDDIVKSDMESIGRELVGRCKGLPLGILEIGKMLATNKTLEYWRRALVITDQVSGGIEKVMQSLTSIYFDLPPHLMPCLLYFAFFEKTTKIKQEKLYHLWMAEGLISSSNDQYETMMHMAESFLNELRLRSLVYVKEKVAIDRRFKSCSVHDLVHDFCLFMGRREEFFLVMGNEPEDNSDSFSSLAERTRRVIFYVGKHDNNKSLVRFKNLRCLLVRSHESQELNINKTLTSLINRIMQLREIRIVEFERIDFGSTTLPYEIADLILLRYLSFTRCVLKKLPSSIAKLPYLQILDLRVRTGCKMEIPNVLYKMKRLRHLYLPRTFQTDDGLKLRLFGLTQLETLLNFNTAECDVEDVFTLTKISSLGVNIEEYARDLKRLADRMQRTSGHELRSRLKFRNFDCYTEERHSVFRQFLASPALHVLYMEGHLGQIPPHGKISDNLTKVVFSGSEIQIDPMPILGMLPKLLKLILDNDAISGKEITCSRSNFLELRHLELSNLSYLKSWRVEETAMPKLSILRIENCSRLEMLPDGLISLSNLRELKIRRMPETFKGRLQVVDGVRGEDMYKVPTGAIVDFVTNITESSE